MIEENLIQKDLKKIINLIDDEINKLTYILTQLSFARESEEIFDIPKEIKKLKINIEDIYKSIKDYYGLSLENYFNNLFSQIEKLICDSDNIVLNEEEFSNEIQIYIDKLEEIKKYFLYNIKDLLDMKLH